MAATRLPYLILILPLWKPFPGGWPCPARVGADLRRLPVLALPDGNGVESRGRFRGYHISWFDTGEDAPDKVGKNGRRPRIAAANVGGGSDRGEHRAQRDRQGVRQRVSRRAQAVARRRRRRVLGARRSVRLRQVDRVADDRRARDDHVRRVAHRRQGRERPRAQGPRHRHGVPVVRLVPAPHRARQHRLRAQAEEDAQGRDQRARRQRGQDPRAHREPRPQAGPAVGWPAPAGGDGPRDRAPTAGVLDGRAAVEPRRQAARPDAGRGLQAPARAQRHHRVRHPRPDRGDDDGRPGGGAVTRRPAAGRHAAGPLRPSRQPLRRGLHRLAADEPARGDGVEQRWRHHVEVRQQHSHRPGVGAGEVPVARRLRRETGRRRDPSGAPAASAPTARPTPSAASSTCEKASAPRSSCT